MVRFGFGVLVGDCWDYNLAIFRYWQPGAYTQHTYQQYAWFGNVMLTVSCANN